MEVGAYLVADAESFELVEPGEGALDDPSGLAQAGAVGGAAAGDLGCDPTRPDETAVFVEVVAAVGEQPPGPVAWLAAQATYAGDGIDERYQLGDIVPVAAGQ